LIPCPEKNCEHCKKPMVRKRFGTTLEDRATFMRRKHCDRTCMAGSMEGRIKVLSPRSSRKQSAKKAKPKCETCGRPRKETRLYVHHVDEDPLNNDPSNLKTLCGSCHQLTHSRSPKGIPKPPSDCRFCSRPAYRRGVCNTHRSRMRRHGDAHAVRRWNGSGEPVYLRDLP
jgi:hypothetical protein